MGAHVAWLSCTSAARACPAVELRGGSRNVKVATKKAKVAGTAILWNESMTL